MKLHFGHLLGLSALAIAGCAAFFSVYGISQLFAGAFMSVVIMASTLEFGKLVAASYLQRYWKKISIGMRIYVATGVAVLVLVTSAGIYGFLSNAYQKTSDALSLNDAKVKNITLKKDRYNEELSSYTIERAQLNTTVNELSKGLANNVIQYKDKETGQIITTTSSNTRRALEAQLVDAKAQRDKITPKMDVLRDSVTSYELQILNLAINNEAGAEIGPLKYISELLDISMDRVVNYFILLLIFVFDPLAIALVLATNWVFEQERIKRENADLAKRFKDGPKENPYSLRSKGHIDDDGKVHIDKVISMDKVDLKTQQKNYLDNMWDKKSGEIEQISDEERASRQKFLDDDAISYNNKQYDLFETPEPKEIPEFITPIEPAIKDAILMTPEEAIEEEPAVEVIRYPDVTIVKAKEEVIEKPVVIPIPVREPIPQNERPVAKNGILKPASNIGRTGVTPDGPIKREDIKEIKDIKDAVRGFVKKIPRRRDNK